MSGFRTFGQLNRPKPVRNRFLTGFGRFGRLEPVPNRFWSIQLPERSKSGHKCPDFDCLEQVQRPITGQYCPVFERFVPIGRLKSGQFTTPRTFEIRIFEIRTYFRPVCQTGRPVFGHSLYIIFYKSKPRKQPSLAFSFEQV